MECTAQPLLAGVLQGQLDAAAFAAAKEALERDLAPTAYQTMACGARVDACTQSMHVELPMEQAQALRQAGTPPLLVDCLLYTSSCV